MIERAIIDTFNELRMSLGADARNWQVSVFMFDGAREFGWPLDRIVFSDGLLHLTRDDRICLIPQDKILKIYLTDQRVADRKPPPAKDW